LIPEEEGSQEWHATHLVEVGRDFPAMRNGVVYMVSFRSGKGYIGQTVQDVKERLKDHMKANSCCHAFKSALAKHGIKSVEILCTVPENQLNQEEVRLISEHKTLAPNGYNILPGGDQMRDPEAQAIMRMARIASEAFQAARKEVQSRPSTALARRKTTSDTRAAKLAGAATLEVERVQLKAYNDALKNARQAEKKLAPDSLRNPIEEVKAFYGDGWEQRKRVYTAATKISKGRKVAVARRDCAKDKRWTRIDSMSTEDAVKFMKQARCNALYVAKARTPDKVGEVQARWAEEWVEFEHWQHTRGPPASSANKEMETMEEGQRVGKRIIRKME
jgi:hypothetical protein